MNACLFLFLFFFFFFFFSFPHFKRSSLLCLLELTKENSVQSVSVKQTKKKKKKRKETVHGQIKINVYGNAFDAVCSVCRHVTV